MLTKRTWLVMLVLGSLGSQSWALENHFFNTCIYNIVSPDPLAISWMVAASTVVATLASIGRGSLSERKRAKGGHKPFIYPFARG